MAQRAPQRRLPGYQHPTFYYAQPWPCYLQTGGGPRPVCCLLMPVHKCKNCCTKCQYGLIALPAAQNHEAPAAVRRPVSESTTTSTAVAYAHTLPVTGHGIRPDTPPLPQTHAYPHDNVMPGHMHACSAHNRHTCPTTQATHAQHKRPRSISCHAQPVTAHAACAVN